MSRESVAFFQKFPQTAMCLVLHRVVTQSFQSLSLSLCKVQRLCFISDHASKALAEPSLPEEPQTYNAISKHSRVSLTTLYYCNYRQCSKEEKAQGQQYLTLSEKKAFEKYLKLIADLRNPVQIKFLSTLVFSIVCQHLMNKATKPLSKNWPQSF
jgi:hypothetical protein